MILQYVFGACDITHIMYVCTFIPTASQPRVTEGSLSSLRNNVIVTDGLSCAERGVTSTYHRDTDTDTYHVQTDADSNTRVSQARRHRQRQRHGYMRARSLPCCLFLSFLLSSLSLLFLPASFFLFSLSRSLLLSLLHAHPIDSFMTPPNSCMLEKRAKSERCFDRTVKPNKEVTTTKKTRCVDVHVHADVDVDVGVEVNVCQHWFLCSLPRTEHPLLHSCVCVRSKSYTCTSTSTV